MIVTSRLFKRKEPSKEAKTIYIFCEGAKREYQYFNYFREIDSRINIVTYSLDNYENNSPKGLLEIAEKNLLKSESNPTPNYEFIDDLDEVWFVIDNEWGKEIVELKEKCRKYKNWNVALSNPCFEVWLYYHMFSEKPNFDKCETSKSWKSFVNKKISGGFDARKHTIYIKDAIINSEANYTETGGVPDNGCTEVFKLVNRIYLIVKDKFDTILKNLN